tara:strand:- start:151 stop:456 length:306 start_codon:yes stop_codon:yes gene_type:complete
MDVYLSLSYWLFLLQFWIILGIIFIGLEILDGSLIFFLPIGLGSFSNSLLLYLQEFEFMFDYQVVSVWHHTLISLAVFSLIFSYILRFLNFKKDIEDPNKY